MWQLESKYLYVKLDKHGIILSLNIKSRLCRTMACFHVISISMIFDGDYPCAHHFMWRLPLSTLLLCSMTHYDITMGNNVARDIHCDVRISNDITMCTSQYITTLLWTSFVMYYYAYWWYCCFTSKLFTIVHIYH